MGRRCSACVSSVIWCGENAVPEVCLVAGRQVVYSA